MQAVAKIIKDMQSKGNNKYSVDMFSDIGDSQRSQQKYEDQENLDGFDSYVKQAKKQKKTDFSNNRKAKRGEL
ncbi:MAG: hypothetical protein ACMV1B_03315 [Prevotella sp.]